MDLLQEGVDRSVIALRLGHESIETTQMYLDADPGQRAAARERQLRETSIGNATSSGRRPGPLTWCALERIAVAGDL